MPRPKKERPPLAPPETVREALREALEVDRRARQTSREIHRLNVEVADRGVHPGALALARPLARLAPDARAEAIAATRRCLDALEQEMDGPQGSESPDGPRS